MRKAPGLIVTFEAAGAIAAYSLVKLDANGKVVVTAAASDYPFGAVQEVGATKAGDSVDVVLEGIVLLRAHAASSSKAYVVAAAAGRVVVKNAPAAGDIVAGRLVQGTAGAQNDLVSVFLSRWRDKTT